MLDGQQTTASSHQAPAPAPSSGSLFEVLFESAWEAIVLAFFVLLFGNIALGIVGEIFSDMTPSLPPGLAGKPLLENVPKAHASHSFLIGREHSFIVLATIFFLLKSGVQLARRSGLQSPPGTISRIKKLFQDVGENWFHLIVANAFGAFITVMVLQFSRSFTLTQVLWHLVASTLQPLAQSLAGVLPLSGLLHRTGALVGWYNQNQPKFMFWFFYTAAICDDLGLPNFKTLGRYLWERLQRKTRAAAAPERNAPGTEYRE